MKEGLSVAAASPASECVALTPLSSLKDKGTAFAGNRIRIVAFALLSSTITTQSPNAAASTSHATNPSSDHSADLLNHRSVHPASTVKAIRATQPGSRNPVPTLISPIPLSHQTESELRPLFLPNMNIIDSLFGRAKSPAERLRQHQRTLQKAQRELDRERTKLEQQEKKLTQDIKKSARAGQMPACKVMAKDLVRTRRHIHKFYQMKTQLQAVSLRIQTLRSNQQMAEAMKGATRVSTPPLLQEQYRFDVRID